MKPYIKTTAKKVFLLMLLVFNKTEWLLISAVVLLLNFWLYPNFMIDANTVKQWIKGVTKG